LSFPVWTAQEAYVRGQTGKFPAKDVADAAPNFNLLLEQPQLDKVTKHFVDEFLPYVAEQDKKGEKKDALPKDEVDMLLAQLAAKDYKGAYNIPLKPVHEKTALLVPEAVASLKVIGTKGVDMELKAIVEDEQQLVIPEPDILKWPVIRDIDKTVHQMYAGAYVVVTLNLYAYRNGKNPGFSAGANVAVFKADGDRIGGGLAIDEDEIFLD
jgi:hypothetical protein